MSRNLVHSSKFIMNLFIEFIGIQLYVFSLDQHASQEDNLSQFKVVL